MNFKRIIGAVSAALLLGLGLAVSPPAQAAAPKPSPPKGILVEPKDLPKSAGTVGKLAPGIDAKALHNAPKGRFPGKGTSKTTSNRSGVGTRAYPPSACAGGCYEYAGWEDNFGSDPITGFSVNMTVPNVYMALASNNNVGQKDSHSLMELAVQKPGTTSGLWNTVEIGLTKDPLVCGQSTTVCLFVYSWVNGVGKGYNNDPNSGFVDLSGTPGYSPIAPGASLASAVGTVKGFGIRYFDSASSGGNPGWYPWYNGFYLGYYPDVNYTSQGQTFVDADYAQNFAEHVASDVAPAGKVESCGDMGTGKFANEAGAAEFSNYNVFGSTETPDMGWNVYATEPTRWSSLAVGSSPVTSVKAGGPGWDTRGLDKGFAGTCGPPAEGTPCDRSIQFWQEIAPDNQTTTGATNMVCYSRASIAIGSCTQLLNWGSRVTHATWNNALQSGYTIEVYKTSNCTGTKLTYGNGQKGAYVPGGGWDGYNVRTFKRTA